MTPGLADTIWVVNGFVDKPMLRRRKLHEKEEADHARRWGKDHESLWGKRKFASEAQAWDFIVERAQENVAGEELILKRLRRRLATCVARRTAALEVEASAQKVRDMAANAGVSVEEFARRFSGPEGDAAADAKRKGSV